MSSDDKPEQRPTPPPPGTEKGTSDASTPSLEELDSAWGEDEELDEDATMVAMVPRDLVALSRRGSELHDPVNAAEAPEKHEAITARPPPVVEASVVVDAPHEQLPPGELLVGSDEEDDDEDLEADDLDAGWDIEEERAAAADVAAGLDAEARRKASEERARIRREKGRAKTLAAKDKRKARAEAIRQKQKKPKKRSVPPPRDSSAGPDRAARRATVKHDSPVPPASRERPTIPPTLSRAPEPGGAAKRDMLRMVFIVAVVVVLGALVIGLLRR